jgi:hypothetical protein
MATDIDNCCKQSLSHMLEKTWTHRCRLHDANVLSHSDDAVVPTKAVSVCANHSAEVVERVCMP